MALARRAPIARGRLSAVLRVLGPGLVAGASDNDPTTVGTVAVVGSTTVYALGWVALLIFPMLAVVQAIAARVGLVTGRDLGAIVAGRFGRRAVAILAVSVLAVAVITLAADLKAGAAALAILSGIDLRWFIVPLGALCLLPLLLGPQARLRKVLQAIALVFLAYVVSAFAVHPDWSAVLRGSLLPSWRWNTHYTAGSLALLGTTLTSYVYVWETIEVSQERPSESVRAVQADAVVGSLFVVVVFWFILVATGATLGEHHHPVQTPAQAASALTPIAGTAASAAFSVGLLASALLALPVLVFTSARLVTARRPTRTGESGTRAFAFAATVVLAAATILSFVDVSTIHLLFAASIAGGIGTPVSLMFLLRVARDRTTMGPHRVSGVLAAAGYLVAGIVTMFGLAAILVG